MSDSMLDIAAGDLDDAQELKPVRSNEEVKLQVIDVRCDRDKNDNPYIMPTFEILDFPTAKNFTKYLALPTDEMDAKKKNNAALALRKFFKAFEIDYSGGQLNIEEIIGATGWAILGVDENEDSEYGPQNYVKRFL